MEEKEIVEIQNLNDDGLLELYDKIVGHIEYLKGSILDTTIIPESEEESVDEQQQS